MTVEQLTACFVEIGVAQDEAIRRDATDRFNRLFGKMVEIQNELEARPGDQRRALVILLKHPNRQVRLNAAKATLEVAPGAARKTLEDIRASGWQPQAADAGMLLRYLDRQMFKLK